MKTHQHISLVELRKNTIQITIFAILHSVFVGFMIVFYTDLGVAILPISILTWGLTIQYAIKLYARYTRWYIAKLNGKGEFDLCFDCANGSPLKKKD